VQALIDARIIDPAVKAAAEANLANHKSTLETMRNLIGLFVEQATNSNGMNPGQPIKTAAAKGQGSAHDLDADVFESEHLAESWAKLAAQAAQYPV
jgi:hypothetical protein